MNAHDHTLDRYTGGVLSNCQANKVKPNVRAEAEPHPHAPLIQREIKWSDTVYYEWTRVTAGYGANSSAPYSAIKVDIDKIVKLLGPPATWGMAADNGHYMNIIDNKGELERGILDLSRGELVISHGRHRIANLFEAGYRYVDVMVQPSSAQKILNLVGP